MARDEAQRIQTREWLESLEYVLKHEGDERAAEILTQLKDRAAQAGVSQAASGGTPYANSIPKVEESEYPGDEHLDDRIEAINRWNAMAMVVRANRDDHGIGGHISSYASTATLWEVALQHFLHGPDHEDGADIAFFQGHSSPGIYARAFLEGRLDREQLEAFRHESLNTRGLSSYPHPRMMKDFWQFPTVSMGLTMPQAIYQARFARYLHARGLTDNPGRRVWAFIGDGELDEPESRAGIALAAREGLSNLTVVVDANLQRLDGPVRGNGQIIQEMEMLFAGAGWKVIKVVWGSGWDALLDRDESGELAHTLSDMRDGEVQRYAAGGAAVLREDLFGRSDVLSSLIEDYTDEDLNDLLPGGHDRRKVYQAYAAAEAEDAKPTIILARTVKGFGLGDAGEASNVTHKKKVLEDEELQAFRDRFELPLEDEAAAEADYYMPEEDSDVLGYLRQRREALGGYLPQRSSEHAEPHAVPEDAFSSYREGSEDRDVATTMVMVQILSDLLSDEGFGASVVPIIPDEARTFGVEALFRKAGIYSPHGQQYEPVDKDSLLFYNEQPDGAILEEGITETGAISSFIAAGTAYSNHHVPMLPFYMFYSMFGFQRIGDLIWAAGDARARGFLIGATSGRTSLPGEGVQHCDGNSHAIAMTAPHVRAYDPAFAYELAHIVREGIRRMYEEDEDLIYYITVLNEKYHMPAQEDDSTEGILRGMHQVVRVDKPAVQLAASGAITNEAMHAAELLSEHFEIEAAVFSVTSWKALYDEGIRFDQARRQHAAGTGGAGGSNGSEPEHPEEPWIRQCLDPSMPVIAASDYIRSVPMSVASWLDADLRVLGTDGFGPSDNRGNLRSYFAVDAAHIAFAALEQLSRTGGFDAGRLGTAADTLGIEQEHRVFPADR